MRIGFRRGLVLYAAALCAQPAQLRVLEDDYPKAFFFRSAEGMASNQRVDYAAWERSFGRLMGIEGKALEEEVPGRSIRNPEFFTKFKQRYPDQLVLLHYNGRSRDPRDGSKFFAGHWLHHNGAKVLADVPRLSGETEIRVSNALLFRTGIGRYKNGADDVAICELGRDGNPDWHACEQTQLVSVDRKSGTIRLRRAQYGTEARAFAAGRAYAAAHVSEGPWGPKSALIWNYNHSTKSPRDKKGRSCDDVLVDDLASLFAPGGRLASFDGIQFDVLVHNAGGMRGGRGVDADGDGEIDNGVFDGVNTYGAGVIEFCRQLRKKMGAKLILADGWALGHQRAFGILNGMESEGWPALSDVEVNDWSGGLNRHFFWAANAAAPVFNYINHKYTLPGEPPDSPKIVPPASTNRLVFAAAVFTDSSITYSIAPPAAAGELTGVWDELWGGEDRRPGWLGKPLGPAMRLADTQPSTFTRTAKQFYGLEGDGVRFTTEGSAVKITGIRSDAEELRFRLRVPVNGPDLVVSFRARADADPRYPKEMARVLRVASAKVETRTAATWINATPFRYSYYFTNASGPEAIVEIAVEGTQQVWIDNIAARAHPDAMYREFERGAVIANPSPRPYTFDLAKLFPGRTFQRIKGTALQDPKTNDGSAVSGRVTLGPKDALFLKAAPVSRTRRADRGFAPPAW